MARKARLVLALSAVLLACQTASADILRNILLGLDYAQFNTYAGRNPVSGGGELETSRTFFGETLDMGWSQLTLSGPVEFTFKTGDRGIQTLDISLNTQGQPLFYSWVADVGGQSVERTGSLLLDATANVNSFGWYTLEFDYSVRETVTQSGRFNDSETPVELDIGPIDIKGNLFADFLAVITEPIFAALDVENVFASFSGRTQIEEELNRRLADSLAESTPLLSGLGFAELLGDPSVTASSMLTASSLDESRTITEEGTLAIAVPDPATVLLLAAGMPFVWRATRRRR